jgi:hypothetical protein
VSPATFFLVPNRSSGQKGKPVRQPVKSLVKSSTAVSVLASTSPSRCTQSR